MDIGTKLFLDKNKSKSSQSKENAISVPLTSNIALLPDGNISEEISLFQLYQNERDSCDKYRFIFTINPICTNILFNMKTEVMKDEGDDNCKVLFDNIKGEIINKAMNKTPLTLEQAIRDTEYSHPSIGGYTYHCGLDIFNNHMLRKKNFIHINKYSASTASDSYKLSSTVYNTIQDYMRDSEGNIIEDRMSYDATIKDKAKMHLYQYDTIYSFYDAFSNNLKEKNGWYGFVNPGTISIGSRNDDIITDKMMMANKSCEFIDMYPDRSLYSFTPKFNKFKNRKENNWDYCITYPYSSDTEMLKTINGSENGAIRCFFSEEYDVNGHKILRCRSLFKHTLALNDKIRLYYKDNDGKENRFPSSLRVVSVGLTDGSKSDYYFAIEYDSVAKYVEQFQNGLFYKKEQNYIECEYYFKLLKKVKKYSYKSSFLPVGQKYTEYNEIPLAYEDSDKYIKVDGKIYVLQAEDLKSDINKMAFGENIYGDSISQIIYTDDISIYNLKDNLGRPVSEVYLTVLKRNKGFEKWYQEGNNDFGSSEIEFSHCFGKLTAGVDLGNTDDVAEMSGGTNFNMFDYNARYLHNININQFSDDIKENMKEYWGEIFSHEMPKTIGNKGYTIDDDVFYGDIIEFSPYDFTETVICNLSYRFNTAQREAINERYCDIWHDEIEKDDYDVEIITKSESQFSVKTEAINGENDTATFKRLIYGNICPEGYIYNGNIPIEIKGLSDNVSYADGEVVNYSMDGFIYKESSEINGASGFPHIEISFKSPIDYNFIKEDLVCFYNKKTKDMVWGYVEKNVKNIITIFVDGESANNGLTEDKVSPNSSTREYFMVISQNSVPTFAKYIPEIGKFAWRNLVNFSELSNTNDLYNAPFANGRLYIQKNINIFTKRQDPLGDYGLSRAKNPNKINPLEKYIIYGRYPYDLSDINYMADKIIACY